MPFLPHTTAPVGAPVRTDPDSHQPLQSAVRMSDELTQPPHFFSPQAVVRQAQVSQGPVAEKGGGQSLAAGRREVTAVQSARRGTHEVHSYVSLPPRSHTNLDHITTHDASTMEPARVSSSRGIDMKNVHAVNGEFFSHKEEWMELHRL